MAVTAPIHTLQDYLNQAAPVLLQIPEFPQLVQADGNSYDMLAKKYPDAAFTMMVMNNLFHHDSEFSDPSERRICDPYSHAPLDRWDQRGSNALTTC